MLKAKYKGQATFSRSCLLPNLWFKSTSNKGKLVQWRRRKGEYLLIRLSIELPCFTKTSIEKKALFTTFYIMPLYPICTCILDLIVRRRKKDHTNHLQKKKKKSQKSM
jgi:hypothetical protein